MKVAWLKGLKDVDAKKEVRMNFKSSALMRKTLTEMLSTKLKAKERSLTNEDAYENVNWAYKQADAQGYKRAMSEVVSLLEDKAPK